MQNTRKELWWQFPCIGSHAQVARCITQFTDGGQIKDRRHAPAVPFVQHYTTEDIRLLAEMDALHGTLSGTTTRKLCERAFRVHNDARYERLASISNGHLYNLRRHRDYQANRGHYGCKAIIATSPQT